MNSNLRSLSPYESKVILSFSAEGREIVKTTDVFKLLQSEPRSRKVINNLVRKGWLTRLHGGRYMLLPPQHGPENIGENNPLALAAATIDPSYIGWWSAASFHGFTTQKPMRVHVAVLRQAPSRTLEGTEINFIQITERKFFGQNKYNLYGRNVSVSDPTKTIIDCIDQPNLCGGSTELARIVFNAMAIVNPRKLIDYAIRMKSVSLLQRLGFLTDIVGRPLPDKFRKKLRDGIPKSARSIFGRRERKQEDIGYVPEWGLFVHARTKELLSEVPGSPHQG